MKIYIHSATAISPQHSFDNVLEDLVTYNTNRLQVIEPPYKDLLDAKLIRRMSRIIRMGTAAAIKCLRDAQVEEPGAIITGTAYGCLEDTGTFLTKMVEQHEDLLPPTPFIQSTHNTVSAQIALTLHCHAYNNTFVHNGFSFESALQDAVLLIKEQEADNILVGSADELTDISYHILTRLDLYKKQESSNIELFGTNTKGTIGGEGTAFFLLSSTPCEDKIVLEGMETFYVSEKGALTPERISDFLSAHKLSVQDVDLVIDGRNGDVIHDSLYRSLQETIFSSVPIASYKHLCGDYPTASSFALWLAYSIIKAGKVPSSLLVKQPLVKRILVCNTYLNKYCSLMLVAKE
ncbi:MAG: beta-ketoacyl synthase N-terminal-like domain-containing protein [Flavipsychrobacter sp.]|nr:beta-ketoacyl synthase N-terminal-like domain-containing protein [Flavipsychrobacter sp.]